jgi:hypothetical protein
MMREEDGCPVVRFSGMADHLGHVPLIVPDQSTRSVILIGIPDQRQWVAQYRVASL